MSHTPLPWERVKSSIFGVNDERDEEGRREAIASCGDELVPARGHKFGAERDANAKKIVQAVNLHDELVRSLSEVIEMVEPVPERYATLARARDALDRALGR